MMCEQIKLGDVVIDKTTLMKGVVTSKTEYLNGCVQFGVIPKYIPGQPYPEEIGIDEGSLNLVKKGKRKVQVKKVIKKELHGGKSRLVSRMRGF